MTLEWAYHPSTVEEFQQLGYPSYATVKRKLDRLTKEGLKRVGAIQWNPEGRPLDVYATWKPSGNHLKHEVLLSKWFMPRWWAGWNALRGYDVNVLRPDAAAVSPDGDPYHVELDRSTEPMWQLFKRLKPYGQQETEVLFVAEHQKRIRQIAEDAKFQCLTPVLLMTTIGESKGKSVCKWLDLAGKAVTL